MRLSPQCDYSTGKRDNMYCRVTAKSVGAVTTAGQLYSYRGIYNRGALWEHGMIERKIKITGYSKYVLRRVDYDVSALSLNH